MPTTTKRRMSTAVPKISEVAFQEQILCLARYLGWRSAHFRPAQTKDGWRTAVAGDGKGFPDLCLVHAKQHRVIYVELKSETGKLSTEQEAWRDALLAAGQEWYLWKPGDYDKATEILKGKRL